MLNIKMYLLLSLAAYATCGGDDGHSEKEKSSTADTSGVISEDKSIDTPGEIEEPSTLAKLIPYLDEMTTLQWVVLSTFTEYNTDTSTERIAVESSTEKSNTVDSRDITQENVKEIRGQILKPSTSVNINLDDVQWKRTFELYSKDGLIGPKELQELIFVEFNGFLFVDQAETCINLINSNGIDKLELEQLKKITPILYCLTKEEVFERCRKANNIDPIFNVTFLRRITDKEDAIKFFLNREDILKLFKRHGQISKMGPIEKDKINKMMFGSYMVALLQKMFCTIDEDKDGRINATDMVKAVYGFDSETVAKESGHEKLASEIFTAGDLNGNGSMCFYEFMVAVMRDTQQKAQEKLINQIPEEKMETSN